MKKQEKPSQNLSTATSTTSLTSEELANLGKSGEPISEQEYAKFVGDLAAAPADAISRINPHTINLLHATLGLASEAGELLDEVKKHIFYGAPLNYDAIHKEQGDMEWYAQLLRNTLGPTRDTVINANVAKLKKRHPNGFSTESAMAKADAVEDKPTVKDVESAYFKMLQYRPVDDGKHAVAIVFDTIDNYRLASPRQIASSDIIIIADVVMFNRYNTPIDLNSIKSCIATMGSTPVTEETLNAELQEDAQKNLEKLRSQSRPPE